MKTKVIAITGGICSGKTFVTDFLAKKGVPIIDADEISRQLLSANYYQIIKTNKTSSSTKAIKQVVKYFGLEILDQQGYINRQQLKKIIFSTSKTSNSNKQKSDKEVLEAIIHPLVYAQIEQQIRQLKNTTNDTYILVSIPLLYETSNNYQFDRILVIDCPKELQIKRCMQRDNLSHQLVLNVINTQASREQRRSIADDIISNSGSLTQLDQQIEQYHQKQTRIML